MNRPFLAEFMVDTGHDIRSSSRTSCTLLRYESAITNLTYRVGYLLHFISACRELLELIAAADSNYIRYQAQIVAAVEVARKTMESAGVVLYAWASCPDSLAQHKAAYIDILKVLQTHEHYVDTRLRKRVRVLLMPLTSTLSISDHDQMRIDKFPSARSSPRSDAVASYTRSTSSSESDYFSSSDSDSDDDAEYMYTNMPPPSALMDPTKVSSRHIPCTKPHPRILWDSHEISSALTGRSGSTSHRRSYGDLQNAAPTTGQLYRSPKQKFGIFLTGKSSTTKDWTGPPAH